MNFIIGEGSCSITHHGHKQAWMMAEEDAYGSIEEGLEKWLEENINGPYTINPEFTNDVDVNCLLILDFEYEDDAMAYKLTWE